jgi:hypothetical protein
MRWYKLITRFIYSPNEPCINTTGSNPGHIEPGQKSKAAYTVAKRVYNITARLLYEPE